MNHSETMNHYESLWITSGITMNHYESLCITMNHYESLVESLWITMNHYESLCITMNRYESLVESLVESLWIITNNSQKSPEPHPDWGPTSESRPLGAIRSHLTGRRWSKPRGKSPRNLENFWKNLGKMSGIWEKSPRRTWWNLEKSGE